jgi:hypothetical protein
MVMRHQLVDGSPDAFHTFGVAQDEDIGAGF